jgi:hypothetical protein
VIGEFIDEILSGDRVAFRLWVSGPSQASSGSCSTGSACSANPEWMQAGRPPQRRNPLTGKVETTVVDLRNARRGVLRDPFATDPDSADAEAGSA